MNMYYKISLLYLVLAGVMAIAGFYLSKDFRELNHFYKQPVKLDIPDEYDEDGEPIYAHKS